MDLNNIHLRPSLILKLYPASLVEANELTLLPDSQTTKDQDWNYIGNNEKNILLLFNLKEQKELNPQQFLFLNKMMDACKIAMPDIVLMNLSQNPDADFKAIQAFFKSQTVLLFGIEASLIGLPLNFPYFQVQSFANCTFLFTPTIEELGKDEILKSKLWVCLRRMFGI